MTATMLIRFCVAIDTVDAGYARDEFNFTFLRLGFCGVVFTRISFLENGGSGAPGGLTLTLSLSRFAPDLQPQCHGFGRESLRGLVNQS